ncbi:rifin PIR protein,putative [Plasmodium sp. DRC-Itaito]|nr:rifin PIR protein,putative [Plasmodium sp. DRC-Itaito]SPJ11213.1 rifin PIR protein,putative [Plasmodium sp. DRC-Itaito]
MKVHYINILLFAHALNILAHNNNKPSISPHHTPTTRSLCECELYAPVNYDNDPQMKSVMENFNKQTQQRFHEYDHRMQEKRNQCKDKCDKEIQKIILKDKLEKQMAQQLTILDTDIQSDAIPTCICEKSLADKVEKGCLPCGEILGTAAPELGLIGGMDLYTLSLWQTKAIAEATVLVTEAAKEAATKAGVKAVAAKLKQLFLSYPEKQRLFDFTKIANGSNFTCGSALHKSAMELANGTCIVKGVDQNTSFCNTILLGEKFTFREFANAGIAEYNATLTAKTPILQARYTAAVDATYMSNQISIIASVVAIVVIVLIMVIIYLILRRRRKKKMKKKLQYIKLLEE